MKKLLTAAVLSLFLYAPDNVQAQTEIGIMGGASIYSGDLSPQEFGLYFENVRPAFGAFARFHIGRAFALRPGISIGQVAGDDANHGRDDRGLSFRSRITEFSLVGELNLFKIGADRNRGVIPYLFGGAAIFSFNPESRFDGDYIELQPLGTEGQGLPNYPAPYRLTQVALPMGIGVKFLLNENLTIGLEFGGRKLFTDFLDDVSDTNVNYLEVLEGNGEIAAQMSNPTFQEEDGSADYTRGGEYNDWYYIGGLSVSFRLSGSGGGMRSGRGIGCPTF